MLDAAVAVGDEPVRMGVEGAEVVAVAGPAGAAVVGGGAGEVAAAVAAVGVAVVGMVAVGAPVASAVVVSAAVVGGVTVVGAALELCMGGAMGTAASSGRP